jgi:hypothetical protein
MPHCGATVAAGFVIGTFARSKRLFLSMRLTERSAYLWATPSKPVGENSMLLQRTHAAAALAVAGALAVASATPSLADSRWGYAAGGFAAGALVGAAAANANAGYWGPGYAYHPGYQGYALAPAPTVVAPAPGYMAYGYAPGYSTFSYGPSYDPENGSDPDPRIGGSFRMNSSLDD